MTCCIDWIFLLFLWGIAVSDFHPLDIYKNLGLPLSAVILQSTATQITISINMFISFKYDTV